MLYTFTNRCNLYKFVYFVYKQRLKHTDATRDISYWCLQGSQK